MQYDENAEKYGYEGEMMPLKCDELKSVYIDRTGDWVRSDNNTGKYYLKSEADAAIAELKSEIRRKEAVVQRWFEQCIEARSEAIRLKRALWLARAVGAHNTKLRYILAIQKEHERPYNSEVTIDGEWAYSSRCRKMEPQQWLNVWAIVEYKCRKKAEEYK